ncbi:MAG: response regulator [Gilvibacter sp.]
MKALKIYIVEDEPLIAATVQSALRKLGYQVVGDSDEYDEALRQIKTLMPDMVLVDIQLEGAKDGVDLASQLDALHIPYLYLTSQTDPTTIDRVKATQPLGYIVKPFTEAGLRSNIELAWHNFSLTKNEFILIKSEGRTHKLNQANIYYLKAFDNYCYVVTDSKKYLVPHTLKKTAAKFNNGNFIQSHRSYWVNVNLITSLTSDLVVLNEVSVPLSASRKEAVYSTLGY